ncbi:Smr/MutS family protein [Vannielia sp.]|uniref:Smr/MutS family protein n=1 Tax=Vannielia sp. TaxID=2813045 RepID=UPI0026277AED|nr:Smr/MutS family protein [Vannielia sp.]MDF1873409.1 Smr/MutS family protein [Vannielia sp.]
MSRKKPPRISKEDEALWRQVVAKATPLEKSQPLPRLQKNAAKLQKEPNPQPIQTFRVGEKQIPSHRAVPQPHPVAPTMDRRAFTRLKRGKLKPEGRIDLHGMTLAEAHPRLTGFVLTAHDRGKRLVLVITGKGRTGQDEGGPIPTHPGVLRRHVPDWLRSPPLGAVVLEITPAHIRHGGEGAYYVYLKRSR